MYVITQAITSNKHFELCPRQLPIVPPFPSLLTVLLHFEMIQIGFLEVRQPVCWGLSGMLTCCLKVPCTPLPTSFWFYTTLDHKQFVLFYFLCACPPPDPGTQLHMLKDACESNGTTKWSTQIWPDFCVSWQESGKMHKLRSIVLWIARKQ